MVCSESGSSDEVYQGYVPSSSFGRVGGGVAILSF